MATFLRTQTQPGLPSWLTASLKLGVPSVLSLFLVWWMTQTFSASMGEMKDDVRATKTAMEEHVSDEKLDKAINRILLSAICENTAQNEAQRTACRIGR